MQTSSSAGHGIACAGCVLCALHRHEEAKAAFKAAIRAVPQHVEVRAPF